MRATIIGIAREAGVSTATVDRVLNNRKGVKEQTRTLVLATAKRLGYVDVAGPEIVATRMRLDFVLPGGNNDFINNLASCLSDEGAVRLNKVDVRVHTIEGFNVEVLAAKLHELRGVSDGIGVLALDHPIVREAIRAASAKGVPVITLVSDISNSSRCGYVGIDNRAAGRLAGYLLGRFLGDGNRKVALLAGSFSYRGHEEREMGFRHVLAEEFQNLEIVQMSEMRDDDNSAYLVTRTLLKSTPDLAGIYDIGGGHNGIARAIAEAGLTRHITVVAHELTESTRRFLLTGVVDAIIDQNPRTEAWEAINRLQKATRNPADGRGPAIGIQVIFRENIPDSEPLIRR